MRKNFKIIPVFLASFLCLTWSMSAGALDGLWRSDRQNVTIRIESDQDGFRAKRIDEGIWYRYSLTGDDQYIDRHGNTYKVLDQNEIEWRDAFSPNRMLFTRIDGRSDGYDPRAREAWDDAGVNIQRGSAFAGRWYDRQSKERLLIEPSGNGYRVRTQHSGWKRFEISNNGRQIRSRSGDVIQLMNRNTIRWRSADDRHVHTMSRQGNGHAHQDRSGFQKHDDKHRGKHHGKHPQARGQRH